VELLPVVVVGDGMDVDVLETDDADDEADTLAVVVAELATYVFVVVGELMVDVAWGEFDVVRFDVFGFVVVVDNDNVDDFDEVAGFVDVVDGNDEDLSIVVCVDCPSCVVVGGSVAGVVTLYSGLP
jgi:hypothetical protein